MTAHRTYHGLASILLEAAVVTPEQVDAALARQHETGLRIGETLVEIGAATEEDIGWGLARQMGLPLVDLQSESLDPELLRQFPAGLLYRLHAVPLLRTDDGLSMAFSDPTDMQANAHLEAIAGCSIVPSVTTPSAIRRVLAPLLGAHAAALPPGHRHEGDHSPVVWDRSGANFLHFHLFAARRAGATAVHFVPGAAHVRVVQRRASGLVEVAREPVETHEALLTQLELLGAPVGDGRGDLHRMARLECPTATDPIPFEVALLVRDGGTVVTLRLPPEGGAPATIEQIGLSATDLARLREVLHQPAGLVVVSGPPRSGASTTLACLLAEALRDERSAMVFGDLPAAAPRERLVLALPGADVRATWQELVHAHEPDVVVLDDAVAGEDVAALTASAGGGRLVLARADWSDSFALLEHLGRRPHARSTTAVRLQAVLQQRLVPAAPGEPAGVRARIEVLFVTDALRAAIRAGAAAPALRGLARADGFMGLDHLLGDDVRDGRTTPAAAARALAS